MEDAALYEKISSIPMNYPIKLRMQHRINDGFAAHWHEHVEILYILSGNYRITCGNESYDLEANDFVFINSKELHFSEQSLTSKYWCMHITPTFFSDIQYENAVIRNLIRGDRYLEELFQKIIAENEHPSPGSDLAVKGYTYLLMSHILRNHQKCTPKAQFSVRDRANFERLKSIFWYISQNYTEKLTTASLAETFFLNEHYFCRLFKNATGQSVTDYINGLRVEKSIVLLENTSETITSIAMLVGFNDLNYYSRIFKRFMNMTPSEYRAQVQNNIHF